MKTLAMAVLLFATTTIDIDTRGLADGAKETRVEGSRRVAVEKSEGKTIVRVEEAGRIDTIVMSRDNGKLSVEHSANNVPRRLFALDRPQVIVDGVDLEPFLSGAQGTPSAPGKLQPRRDSAEADEWPRFYICPKDEAMLRVPRPSRAASAESYNCPLDGTPMKRGVGPQSQYWLLE
jgi:hypothetical protein